MAKFRFRLATLRKLRKSHRDELRAKLAEAYHAVQKLEEQQLAITDEILALQDTQRRATKGATTSVNSLLEAQRYQAVLRAQQSTLRDHSKVLSTEVERRRQNVIEADQQVRVLDKLNERQRLDHQQTLSRAEVRELDEIASRSKEVNQSWLQ
ncbi:MAG: flagellar export protein FliJ [Planctomycetes bacterium]|nr:flagellar export protein FliJ [Planctomycetota bacterium]